MSDFGLNKHMVCWFCDQHAITRNPDGLQVCGKHKEEVFADGCPFCKQPLEVINSPKGEYFKCYSCNVNFSQYKLRKFKKEFNKNEK